MKKCPYCGAELSDESLFCTECGKELSKNNMCPHCGASVNDGDVFCMECGKKIDEVPTTTTKQPKCPHCGACVNEGDVYCMECGKAINEKPTTIAFEEVKEETPPPLKVKPCPYCGKMIEENDVSCNHCGRLLVEGVEEEIEKKTLIDYLPYLLGVVVVLAFIGGAWWFYDAANQRITDEREKAIADSLEVIRQDSIRKAEALAEEERLEAERIHEFQNKFTFSNVLALLRKPNNSNAQKCGLSLLYKDIQREEGYDEGPDYFESKDIVYGFDVEKGNKHENGFGYEINATSDHACYYRYVSASDDGIDLCFINKLDADKFFDNIKDNGLIEYGNGYYIPKKKTSSGITHKEEFDPFQDAYFGVGVPQKDEDSDFYYISIYLCNDWNGME